VGLQGGTGRATAAHRRGGGEKEEEGVFNGLPGEAWEGAASL